MDNNVVLNTGFETVIFPISDDVFTQFKKYEAMRDVLTHNFEKENIEYVRNVIESKEYDFIPNIKNYIELGVYFIKSICGDEVPEYLLDYINYEKYAKEQLYWFIFVNGGVLEILKD